MCDKERMVHERLEGGSKEEGVGVEITGTHCSEQCVQSGVKVFFLPLALGTFQIF